MKHSILSLSACIAATLATTACSGGSDAKANDTANGIPAPTAAETSALAESLANTANPKDVVAKIDGTIEITRGEVDNIIDMMIGSRAAGIPPADLAQFRNNLRDRAIEQLVLEKLLLRAVETEKFAVAEDAVDTFIASQLPEGVTLEDIAKRQGMTAAALRDEVKKQFTLTEFIEKRIGDIPAPTEEQIAEFFDKLVAQNPQAVEIPESVEARHILFKVDKDASADEKAEIRKKAEAVQKELVDGADFAEKAKELSDCPSGRQGGDLGRFERGRMVKEFEEAAFTQAENAIGEVVETTFGFHIIQVTKKYPASKRTVESEHDTLVKMLVQQTRQERATAYLEGLKNAAKVEILEPTPAPEPAPAESQGEGRPLPEWAR